MLKVLKQFKYAYRGIDVVEYKPGDEIPDGDDCEAVALQQEWVKKVKGKAPAHPASIDPGKRPEKQEDVIRAIGEEIGRLNPDEDFTRTGVPSVPALERNLDFQISAEERDQAWAIVSGKT